MTITYIGAGTASAVLTTADATPGYPSGLAAGDLLMLFCSAGVSTLYTTTAVTGFTQRYALQSGGLSPSGALFYKVATGSETGTVTVAHPGGGQVCRMFAYRGVDNTNPFDVATDATFGSSTAVTAYNVPAQTPVTAHCAGVTHSWSNSASADSWTPPSVDGGYTEIWDSGGTAQQQEVAHKLDYTTTAATSIRNIVRSVSNKGGAAGVLLRPSGTGPKYKTLVGGVWTANTKVKSLVSGTWTNF